MGNFDKHRINHDSANIRAIEKILTSTGYLVHTPPPVLASPIFTYWRASDPLSLVHDYSAEIITPKGNTNPRVNPPNPVTNIPADPDSDPSSSYSSSSE